LPFLCTTYLHLPNPECWCGKGPVHVQVIGHHIDIVQYIMGAAADGESLHRVDNASVFYPETRWHRRCNCR